MSAPQIAAQTLVWATLEGITTIAYNRWLYLADPTQHTSPPPNDDAFSELAGTIGALLDPSGDSTAQKSAGFVYCHALAQTLATFGEQHRGVGAPSHGDLGELDWTAYPPVDPT